MTADARPTAALRLRLNHPTSNMSDERMPTLVIEDVASGVVLADIRMTSDQFVDLLANRGAEVDARVPTEVGVSRLFREQEVETVGVPTDIGTRYDYKNDAETRARVDKWADQFRADWDSVELQLNSQRFYVTLRRWAPR